MKENAKVLELSQEDKQFNKNKWIFSLTGIGRDIAYQLVATFLLTYIQFGISLTAIQFTVLYIFIAIGGKLWDAINDPFMGAIIEGSKLKFGKFKPWILMGGIGCGAVIMLMFSIRPLGWGFVVFMAIIYLLWESTFTMNDIGYWAMLPSLSSKTKQRNSVTTLTVLFAGIGAIIAQGVIPSFTTANMVQGYLVVGLAVGTIYILANTLCAFLIKETPRQETSDGEKISVKKMLSTIKKNDQILWMTLSMLFYNVASTLLVALAANLVYIELGYNGDYYFYVVVAYGIPSVLGNVFYPKIAGKWGRKKVQTFSIIMACIGYTVVALLGWASFLPFNIFILCGFVVFISLGQTWFYLASIVNMTNCVEYNQYKYGQRNEAVISTLRPFMAKFADALKYGITISALLVSGIYAMSQSISALETQKAMFEKLSASEQYSYVMAVKDYYHQIQGASDSQLVQLYQNINHEIAEDQTMSKWQLYAEDIVVLGEVKVLNGNQEVLLKDVAWTTAPLEQSTFELTSAANSAFRDRASFGARLTLRLAVTVAPIVLLIIALTVQRKKFVIDEAFYEHMMEEIKSREVATE